MFRATEKQLSLLGAEVGLADSARKRLRESWAEGFRLRVMPVLLATESEFAVLYGRGGRPNWSLARLVGLSLLQQLQDLSDQQALDALSFDVRFQHALDVAPDAAYLSRRSLVEFRRRLVEHDPDGLLLRGVFDRICAAGLSELGLSTSEQRLDSTLIASNIRAHGRLSVARETLRVFVRGLDDEQSAQLPDVVRSWYQTTTSGTWDETLRTSDRQARLLAIGRHVAATLQTFSEHENVAVSEAYQLLRRLADEHGDALGLRENPRPSQDDHDNEPPTGTGKPQVKTTNTKAEARESARKARRHQKQRGQRRRQEHQARYWSPHDPDASYGHKGLGYHVHIAETCRNVPTELLTDYAVVTAAQSDVGQGVPALNRLMKSGLQPRILYADGGYPTPSDLVNARAMGTNLHAPVNRGRLPVDTYSRTDFQLNPRRNEVLSRPTGHVPTRHGERESSDSHHPRRARFAFFSAEICSSCPQLSRCPVRQPNNTRSHDYRLELSNELLARDRRWTEQTTEHWKSRYRVRSGVEATMSELKRGHGLGRLRVRGLARVCIQVALKATACNVKRWLRAFAALVLGLLMTCFHLLTPWTRTGKSGSYAFLGSRSLSAT
jgi:hypothetical protein